jgi:hypothetical protein
MSNSTERTQQRELAALVLEMLAASERGNPDYLRVISFRVFSEAKWLRLRKLASSVMGDLGHDDAGPVRCGKADLPPDVRAKMDQDRIAAGQRAADKLRELQEGDIRTAAYLDDIARRR